MAKGRVVVNIDRCKGCALCTLACPPKLLGLSSDTLNALGYHPVRFEDPQGRCTGCALCAVVCPDVCFTIYRTSTRRAEQHCPKGTEARS